MITPPAHHSVWAEVAHHQNSQIIGRLGVLSEGTDGSHDGIDDSRGSPWRFDLTEKLVQPLAAEQHTLGVGGLHHPVGGQHERVAWFHANRLARISIVRHDAEWRAAFHLDPPADSPSRKERRVHVAGVEELDLA